jgi:dTDP-4-amino-4,6-dideoxygalactose transaminase
MIPYYSPHFGIKELIKALFCNQSKIKLFNYFRKVTGKKYILITSSCRSALYLAYKVIEKQGIVHTSPLTCQVALYPILATGNKICFHDIKRDDWTINPDTIPGAITLDSIAIQAIHLGGFPCDMVSLRKMANEYSLILIEDCAQGFGSKYQGYNAGELGDISCFTLTKNLFGLGGGVFATDNEEWFKKAEIIQNSFIEENPLKIIYRIIMSILSTYRNLPIFNKTYCNIKNKKKINNDIYSVQKLLDELTKPPTLYSKAIVARFKQIKELVEIRKKQSKDLLTYLNISKDMYQYNDYAESSYTKLYILFNKNANETIKWLNNHGIEAMHLEHKYNKYYQEKLIKYHYDLSNIPKTPVYDFINDVIVSIPVIEGIDNDKQKYMITTLKSEML